MIFEKKNQKLKQNMDKKENINGEERDNVLR